MYIDKRYQPQNYLCDKTLFQSISKKYAGIRHESLNGLNPEYSCVICSNTSCEHHNKDGLSCPNYQIATEEQFITWYNF